MQVTLVGSSLQGFGETQAELIALGKSLAVRVLNAGFLAQTLEKLSAADQDVVAASFIAAGGSAIELAEARATVARRSGNTPNDGMRRKHIILAAASGGAGLVLGVIVGRMTKR